jgi:serine/threonine-protein kinase
VSAVSGGETGRRALAPEQPGTSAAQEPSGFELEAEPALRANPPAEELLGASYRRIRRIGSGGMADVFEVEHLRLGARYAAKILRPGRDTWESSVRRFLREARLLARLKSDHIVRVFDVSESGSATPFYVMELLEGRDLRGLVRAGELSIGRATKIVADACAGVAVAHAHGLVHRDLKPENLFITHRDSGEEVCKLLDFGVSKAHGPTTTEDGALIGTVAYMAPEQIESAGTVTASADIYALGAILYEALAGRPPHVADTVERLLFNILTVTPESVRKQREEVPEALDAAILRALARRPEERFASVVEFLDVLRPFTETTRLSTGSTLRDYEASLRGWRPPARKRRSWTVLAALGAVILALWALTHQGTRAGGAPEVRALVVEAPPALTSAGSTALPTHAVAPTPAPEPSLPVAVAPSPRGLEPVAEVPEPVHAPAPTAARPASPKRHPLPTSSASAHVVRSPPGGPLPKIQFELENPYAH